MSPRPASVPRPRENSPNCGPDGKLAYPYSFGLRARVRSRRVRATAGRRRWASPRRRSRSWWCSVSRELQDRATGRSGRSTARPGARVRRSGVSRLGGGARAQLQHLGSHLRVRGGQPDRHGRGCAARRRAQRCRAEAVRGDQRLGSPRAGLRRRPRGQEDHRVPGWREQRRSGSAGAVPVGQRLRRAGRERRGVRGAETPGRDGEVVG